MPSCRVRASRHRSSGRKPDPNGPGRLRSGASPMGVAAPAVPFVIRVTEALAHARA